MTSATVVSGETRDAVRRAATPDPKPAKAPRAPSIKRPADISDLDWEIMRAAKNEDVHTRIRDIMNGTASPSPEEASVLLEVVMGAERSALMTIVKLRKTLAPKIEAAAKSADDLNQIRMQLFRLATGR